MTHVSQTVADVAGAFNSKSRLRGAQERRNALTVLRTALSRAGRAFVRFWNIPPLGEMEDPSHPMHWRTRYYL